MQQFIYLTFEFRVQQGFSQVFLDYNEPQNVFYEFEGPLLISTTQNREVF